MKTGPECAECLGKLALHIAEEAAIGRPELLEAAREAAQKTLIERYREGKTVPTRVATRLFRRVVEATGVADPFSHQKEREHARALTAARHLATRLGGGLEELVALSLAGNRIDFFREIEEVEAEWREAGTALSHDDTPALLTEILSGATLLILADNAGEISFDLPLLNELRARGIEVSYAVKGRPSQNDLTRADLSKFGIEVQNLVDTGTDWIGCDLKAVGGDFRAAWARAGVVLAKGMANLETLTEYPDELRKKRVFFGLVVKCAPVAHYLGLPLGRPALIDARRLA